MGKEGLEIKQASHLHAARKQKQRERRQEEAIEPTGQRVPVRMKISESDETEQVRAHSKANGSRQQQDEEAMNANKATMKKE